MNIVTDEKFLRQKSKRISKADGLALGRKMHEFLLRFNRNSPIRGVGLSAPQIGKLVQVCIFQLPGWQLTLVNPRILSSSHSHISFNEGCLSFPKNTVDTFRHNWIVIDADNLQGKMPIGSFERPFNPNDILKSVIVQHEIDHLNGILMFDRQEDLTTSYGGFRLGITNQDGNETSKEPYADNIQKSIS